VLNIVLAPDYIKLLINLVLLDFILILTCKPIRKLGRVFIPTNVTCDITLWSCVVIVITQKPGTVICIYNITI